MIDERANWHLRGERRHAADMVGVKMRGDQIVDARDARLLHRGLDATGIASLEARPAGIDEQRLA